MTGLDQHAPISGLDVSVADRLVAEVGAESAERVIRCLRTAEALLRHGSEDGYLRYAESAAYNLREALDSVVRDRPAGEGGLSQAIEAWRRYKLTTQLPGADGAAALAELANVLDSLASSHERQSYMTRKLLQWFRAQTGVEPSPGEDDPTVQYQRLRESAARILHRNSPHAEVEALFGETVAWLVRFFTPPSDIVHRLEQLAECPYSSALLVEFRSLALNAHHLRLFLERLEDPAWLEPMREVGLIELPQLGEPWPVTSLAGESRRLPDAAVTGLLERLLGDLKYELKDRRAACAWEIARTASGLGRAGLEVVLEVLRLYPADDWIQMIAMSATKEVDVTDPIHVAVADAVIGNEPRLDHGHRTETMLKRLVDGMTEGNVAARFGLLATKVRRLASDDQARHVFIDVVALPVEGEDLREPLLQAAQCLAAVVPKVRMLGMSGPSLLQRVETIPGELGQRLKCQVLAGATDIDRHIKLSHLATRFGSEVATGDDKALLDDLQPLADSELVRLRAAFGTPSLAPADGARKPLGARAWRWSTVLPDVVLAGWKSAINAVSEVHGAPDPSALTRRTATFGAISGSPPISADDLANLGVLDAAALVAAWRPSPDAPWGVSARELARALESVVKADPEAWTQDPVAVVRTLREPVYVDHYFRAIAASAAQVIAQAPALVRAVALVRDERWEPTVIGKDNFEYEDDWSVVDTVAVELIDALADAGADLAEDLQFCWMLACELTRDLPEDLGTADRYVDSSDHDDPLNRAINSTYGRGLQAVLALGGWEHRSAGPASPTLDTILTEVLAVQGAVGLELRSVIAASRTFVEAIAGDWLAQHQDSLFGDELGQVTFDQTLKYSRPTKVFYGRSFERLLDAARRGAYHGAVCLLVAYLWDEPGYTLERIIDGLAGNSRALIEVGREAPRLSGDAGVDHDHILQRGIALWEVLLTEAGHRVPVSALSGLGGWALAANLDQSRWLELTEQTVDLTGAAIDHASEVAERCRDAQPSPAGLRILAALLGHGDRWDQHHIEGIGVEALSAAAKRGLADETFKLLQERLIQRGRHDAARIRPGDNAEIAPTE
ncbi:hypothetical protein [Actinopolymorpha alba]|uniref:hypothetical protein n=1 Tax=Actinopolymorpha alba TaxID=533267 RepID=UPI00037CC4A8|nr:hypothetical protein [Actinopolymorpha alba]